MTRACALFACVLTAPQAAMFDMPVKIPSELEEVALEVQVVCDGASSGETPAVWHAVDPRHAVARAPSARHCRALLRRSGARRYLASSSAAWGPRVGALEFHGEWLRTVRASSPGTRVSWVGETAAANPECSTTSTVAMCLYVPAEDAGVLVADGGAGVRFILVDRGGDAGGAWQDTRWGRAIRVRAPQGASVSAAAHALAPAFGSSKSRLHQVRPSSDVRVHAVAPSFFWIAGAAASDRLDVSAPGRATLRLPLRELVGPAAVARDVALASQETIEGEVLAAATRLEGAVVLLTRLLEEPQSGLDREEEPRAEFVAETTTDVTGSFRFGSLTREKYELLVVHPSRGRARVIVTPPARPRIRVAPRAVVRGRVVSAGVPVAGAMVSVLPGFEAVTSVQSPAELFSENVRTGLDGLFESILPDEGRVTLTITKEDAAARVELGDAASFSGGVDLGDIRLDPPIDVEVHAGIDPGCVMQAAGPLGEPGMAVVRALPVSAGVWAIRVRLPGRWLLEASCAGRAVQLAPAMVTIQRDMREPVRLEIRRQPRVWPLPLYFY